MTRWDYIIVGAGSAGCVLAYRLSANPAIKVLLLEAGPEDRSPWIHMPKGMGRLFADPRHAWYFKTEAQDGVPEEIWLRGKMLGGSSSINGMMYFRGQPQDYDGWEALGATGWGWSSMGPAFRAIEKHELGEDGVRGGSGLLGIEVAPGRTLLTEAFIKAGEQMGLRRVEDLNRPDQGGVGYGTRTISRGRRMSAARAFLRPARKRPNLTVITDAAVSRLIVDGRQVRGVVATLADGDREFRAAETILSTGALVTPKILMMSGIGPASQLKEAGVDVVQDSPGVGRHLFEHRLLMMRYELSGPLSQNREYRGWRLPVNALRYAMLGKGPLAAGGYEVAAFARVLPDAATPDVEILMAPFVADRDARGRMVSQRPETFHMFGYPLRSRSEGTIEICSADPAVPARIRPAYLTDPYDRAVTVAMYRYMLRWMDQPAIASIVKAQLAPSPLGSDDEIIAAFRANGQPGFHACGTCRMGSFNDAAIDARTRVRGVAGLRVVDTSIMPAMVSANTNGPMMAAAWHAADLILEDHEF